jgi:large subunit ribosomal protein L18
MFTRFDRRLRREALKGRIRRRLAGSAERPRLAVFRSRRHFYIQAVDDAAARTICSASTLDPEVAPVARPGGNVAAAKAVGALIAERLKALGIERAVFDRSGYLYHGRVRAAADAAREKGMKF